jgi:hypothetical protein
LRPECGKLCCRQRGMEALLHAVRSSFSSRRGDVILAESGGQIGPFDFILVREKQSELQTLNLIQRIHETRPLSPSFQRSENCS